jgi:hypothetical protein
MSIYLQRLVLIQPKTFFGKFQKKDHLKDPAGDMSGLRITDFGAFCARTFYSFPAAVLNGSR